MPLTQTYTTRQAIVVREALIEYWIEHGRKIKAKAEESGNTHIVQDMVYLETLKDIFKAYVFTGSI